jgi:hypothetical protein
VAVVGGAIAVGGAGAAVAGPAVPPGEPGWLEAGVVIAVPVGAGAAAWVVAGRLAHPLPSTATTSSDATT